jgi:putative hydrolase of the HAD superfamily
MEGVERLRDACAEQIRRELELPGLEHAVAREAMLAALRFRAFPDAEPALRDLRARGVRLVAASNWDASLPDGLESTGLAPYLDGAVSSAVVGAAKPDPAVFHAALAHAGCEPHEAFHVGDSPDGDVEGARAAGVRVALLDRHGVLPDPPEGVPKVGSLADVATVIWPA